jgi:hypothetical protein
MAELPGVTKPVPHADLDFTQCAVDPLAKDRLILSDDALMVIGENVRRNSGKDNVAQVLKMRPCPRGYRFGGLSHALDKTD